MLHSKECRNMVIATLVLLALVQPGAIMVATTDAPYNLARTLATWGEAFLGGSPFLLAYAAWVSFRGKKGRFATCAGGLLVFVALVAIITFHFEKASQIPYGGVLWMLELSAAAFLFAVIFIPVSLINISVITALPSLYGDFEFTKPLGIVEVFLIACIVLLILKWKVD